MIEAIVITKKTTPITQRIITIVNPFRCSEYGIFGFLPSTRCAMPNNNVNELIIAEMIVIIILTKIGAFNVGKFIISLIKVDKEIFINTNYSIDSYNVGRLEEIEY
ncbi:hypothetical protein [Lutibacter oceani]|uniref:hypothetical protein n=1 Tax=Lutibacter oceani TaxID=1853311 RepID=UPI000E231C8E|nr:hypothetical protein [Lutibacter oceani]